MKESIVAIGNSEKVAHFFTLRDYTEPEAEIHPVKLVMDRVIANLLAVETLPSPEIRRGKQITTVRENFDSLLFPNDSIMRSSHHTIYVDETHVLRSQMAYLLPSFLHEGSLIGEKLAVAPGLVYRKEGTHHQMDIWYVKQSSTPFSQSDVRSVVDSAVSGLILEERRTYKPKDSHYFHNGISLKTIFSDKLLTVVDGGVIVPDLFRNADLNPNEYQGIALGVSLDRLAMHIKNIGEHEILRSRNPHDLAQMTDLEEYHKKPKLELTPKTRDISVVVDENIGLKEILEVVNLTCDEVTKSMIERSEVLLSIPYGDINPERRMRLGINEGQKNMLIRFVLHSLDGTLIKHVIKQEGNEARDRLYDLINNLDYLKYKQIIQSSQNKS